MSVGRARRRTEGESVPNRRCANFWGWWTLALTVNLSCMGAAQAMDEATLTARLRDRFEGDRTGACVAAATIEAGRVTRSAFCAKRGKTPPDVDSAFEIGSVTKTMTAFLVADLVASGAWTLSDPIARHLPVDTKVPSQGERQIEVRDLLAHSSGLPAMPSRLGSVDNADPYAMLTEESLLASLADVNLSRPIGSRAEYSNFGMMLVSLAVGRSHGDDFEGALKSRLFAPLGMKTAFVASQPEGVVRVQGHQPSGRPTPPWGIRASLAGVGMVKASLNDMVLYAQAELNSADPAIGARMRLTQQPLANGWGMNWALPRVKGRQLTTHEGGTGGFSSLVALDIAAQRAVVVLADTALVNLGGLSDLGFSLLGIELQVRPPRITQAPPAALRTSLLGHYAVLGTPVRIYEEGDRLMWHDPEQGALELLYDSAGEFFPAEGEATLRPVVSADGKIEKLLWLQGGGRLEVSRIRPPPVPPAGP